MNRRKAIRSIAFASGSLIVLPAWMGCNGNDTSLTHFSSFSSAEQEILAGVVDTIIPAGDAVGALSVGIDKYLQKLIDQCFEKDVQDNVKKQLHNLNKMAEATYHQPFFKCTQQQRQDLLLRLAPFDKKAENDFFTLIKSETINGFITSKEVMTKYFNYQVAPGHYYGCIEVKT